jgi:hypothetical protein
MYHCNLSNVEGFNQQLSTQTTVNDHVKSIDCKYKNENYKIISYNKSSLTTHRLVEEYGALRSVIMNSLNQVICFSPPKSISYWEFMAMYPEWYNGTKQIIAPQEYVEGTMVNVFWDPCISEFVLSTKNTVGAESSFFVQTPRKTFRQMFEESAVHLNLDINMLNQEYCYSFVMQHPDNTLVTHFLEPMLHLIAVYKIMQLGGTITVDSVNINIAKSCNNLHESGVTYLHNYDLLTSYQESMDKYASVTTPYHIQGVVFTNLETGERCKVRNPNFDQVKMLRGNQPKSQFQFLKLTFTDQYKVDEFLSFYPEFRYDFSRYNSQLHEFLRLVLSNYSSCYVNKMAPLMSYPKQFRTHMYNLHALYTTVLKPDGKRINASQVYQYISGIPTDHLMYALNFDSRQPVESLVIAPAL